METKCVFMAFAAVMVLSGLVCAQYDNSLSMFNLSVSPNPVVAGGNVTIRFQLYNAYEAWFYGTSLQLSGSYPLLNTSPLSNYAVGMLNASVNPRYYNYTIQIPNTAPSGVYTITFTATYFVYAATGTETAVTQMPVSFYVNNKPAIKVVALSSQPATLYAGYNQTVELAIENTGYGNARNVSVTVSAEPGTSLLSSVTTFFISNLTKGSIINEPILVAAKSVSNAGILANITYYSSSLNQRFSSVQSLNLFVAPSAQFGISAQSSGASPGLTDVPIRFAITNTGTSDATQVQINLQTSYPVTPVSSTAFIAKLPAGATTNVTFIVSIDSGGVPGNYPVTIYEQWKQPNGAVNQQFTGSNNYFVTVSSSSANSYVVVLVIIAVVVVALVALFYRRGRAKKGKK